MPLNKNFLLEMLKRVGGGLEGERVGKENQLPILFETYLHSKNKKKQETFLFFPTTQTYEPTDTTRPYQLNNSRGQFVHAT